MECSEYYVSDYSMARQDWQFILAFLQLVANRYYSTMDIICNYIIKLPISNHGDYSTYVNN